MRGLIMALIVLVVVSAAVIIGMAIEKRSAEREIPLHISDLEKGGIYIRPDNHHDVVLFLSKDGMDVKVTFLPKNCPKRFTIIETEGKYMIVPVPPK